MSEALPGPVSMGKPWINERNLWLNLVANAVHGSARVRGTAIQHVCMSAGHRRAS